MSTMTNAPEVLGTDGAGLYLMVMEGAVYRVRHPEVTRGGHGPDASFPMDRRWECSLAHFARFRESGYGWARPVGV